MRPSVWYFVQLLNFKAHVKGKRAQGEIIETVLLSLSFLLSRILELIVTFDLSSNFFLWKANVKDNLITYKLTKSLVSENNATLRPVFALILQIHIIISHS